MALLDLVAGNPDPGPAVKDQKRNTCNDKIAQGGNGEEPDDQGNYRIHFRMDGTAQSYPGRAGRKLAKDN